jgi:hypothetical protein
VSCVTYTQFIQYPQDDRRIREVRLDGENTETNPPQRKGVSNIMAASKKFVALIHYIISNAKDPIALGATKLNKIAWFADASYYRMTGSSMTGEQYVKRQHGPVPRNVLSALNTLEDDKKIVIRHPAVPFQVREFISLEPADTTLFSEQERGLVDAVMQEVCENFTASSISLFSHNQIWEAAAIGEELPLFAVLASEAGEITEDDLNWATAETDSITAGAAA